MKFKISISAEVDFTEMLQPENVEGAKMALGANNEMELVKKFSENFLANTQSYASSFGNVGNIIGDISRIESDELPQAQETDDDEAQQEVDFRETMRKLREYHEQQQEWQQQQETEGDTLSDKYLGSYVDDTSLSQEEPDKHYAEDYDDTLAIHMNTGEAIKHIYLGVPVNPLFPVHATELEHA